MIVLFLGMIVCVGLAVAVILFVASPSFRDGERVLTPKGEERVEKLRTRASSAAQRAESLGSRGAGRARSARASFGRKHSVAGENDEIADTEIADATDRDLEAAETEVVTESGSDESAEWAAREPRPAETLSARTETHDSSAVDERPAIDDTAQAIDIRDRRPSGGDDRVSRTDRADSGARGGVAARAVPRADRSTRADDVDENQPETHEPMAVPSSVVSGLAGTTSTVPGIATPGAAVASAQAASVATDTRPEPELRVEKSDRGGSVRLDKTDASLSVVETSPDADAAPGVGMRAAADPTGRGDVVDPKAASDPADADTKASADKASTDAATDEDDRGATPSFLERLGRPLERAGADTDRIGPRHAR